MRKTAVALDLVMAFVFVAIGRSVHDHGMRFAGIVSTAWPFLVGARRGRWCSS